jgi:lipopolysaccharide biosynthesis protein
MSNPQPRIVALHLPQYHRIPENDRWWGDGFTEWTNVRKGRKWFPWHKQPLEPGELGYYDLSEPTVLERQAAMARAHGIGGFCFYHYWFHGQRLLEKPVEAMLSARSPDFPFCLCWANESWTGAWGGDEKRLLLEQTYSPEDHREHARHLAKIFADPRHLRVEGRPVFLVYRASRIPEGRASVALWREEWRAAGLDPYLVRVESGPLEVGDPKILGFDASMDFQPAWRDLPKPDNWFSRYAWRLLRRRVPAVHDYGRLARRMAARGNPEWVRFPGLTPMWDNTCRRDGRGLVLKDSTPEAYGIWLGSCMEHASRLHVRDPLVFVNAWNEWGEGCHLEPDLEHGRAYLDETRRRAGVS